MSQPFIKGEKVFKAVWPREGASMRILAGTVALASEANFYVDMVLGGGESLLQSDTGGWCRTQDEALGHLLQRLGRSADYIGNDLLRVQGRIQAVKNLRSRMAAAEASA